MPKITTFLAFEDHAEEAARFYASVFENSRIGEVTRYGDAGPGPKGSVMTVSFELDGQEFVALNGGPHFAFTDAISLSVACETQQEVDTYWDRLCDGGEEGPRGWLKDRFGLWWQINPTILSEMLADPDPDKSRWTAEAMLKMKKIIIEDPKRAYEGKRQCGFQ